jgi:hypothetical protein
VSPIVFLDVDGVLNHSDWYEHLRPRYGTTAPVDWLDPACVARLDRLCRATGAAVVVSSSWRLYLRDKGGVAPVLAAAGLTAPVVGETPDHTETRDPDLLAASRWGEIRAWLAAHPGVTRWAAIDDCDWGIPAERFVRTSLAVGLTDGDCERAAAILARADEREAERPATAAAGASAAPP